MWLVLPAVLGLVLVLILEAIKALFREGEIQRSKPGGPIQEENTRNTSTMRSDRSLGPLSAGTSRARGRTSPKRIQNGKYRWSEKPITVKNSIDEASLEKGWADTPAVFEPYKGPRPRKTQDQDYLKWVDGCTTAGLSGEHRNRIKAQFLRADSFFWRSPDAPSAAINAMRPAFTQESPAYLLDAGILTKELLENDRSAAEEKNET